MLSEQGLSLLKGLLTYDPKKRLTCDAALRSEYFREDPRPIDPSMFPTWPAKSEQEPGDKGNNRVLGRRVVLILKNNLLFKLSAGCFAEKILPCEPFFLLLSLRCSVRKVRSDIFFLDIERFYPGMAAGFFCR